MSLTSAPQTCPLAPLHRVFTEGYGPLSAQPGAVAWCLSCLYNNGAPVLET